MFHKRKKKNYSIWIILILVLVVLVINSENIARYFSPIPYREIIFKEAADAGVDRYLLAAIVKTESNYDPMAVSVKGARGLMQIMPDTGKWVAEQRNQGFSDDQLFNPQYNVRIGALYVSDLYKEFQGNTILVLAAYNGGQGNVKKWQKNNNWTGDRSSIDQIPFPETRQFVRKVLFYQQMYKRLYGQGQK